MKEYLGREGLIQLISIIKTKLLKKADLNEYGKVPEAQLPEMNYDTKGSAAVVQVKLNNHINDINNPHKVTVEQIGAAAKEHTHNASDINAGAVAVQYGGTGASNAEKARSNLGITPANIGAVSTDDVIKITNGGTGASNAEKALVNLGALPLTGGTMTGTLKIDKASSWGQIYLYSPTDYLRSIECDDSRLRLDVRTTTEANNRRCLDILSSSDTSDVASAIRLIDVVDGTSTTYNLFGAHNYPTKLATARNITVNVGSTTINAFDGSTAITTGIIGTLGVDHGGTGLTSLTHTTYTASVKGIYFAISAPVSVPNGQICLVYT